MAIYHFSMSMVQRSKGQSAVASAAYRSGSKIKDQRLDKTYNYAKKPVADSFILAPADAPFWALERDQLWNNVEAVEKRKDAQLAREIKIALPNALTLDEQRELLENFVQENFVNNGMVADCAIHDEDENNVHAHVLLTTRRIDSEGFKAKERAWNHKDALEAWRANWASQTNEFLESLDLDDGIDHRSFAERGIDLEPTIHEGPAIRAMEHLGKQTAKGNTNREIKSNREEIESVREEIKETEAKNANQRLLENHHQRSKLSLYNNKLKVEERSISEKLNKAENVDETLKRQLKEKKELEPKTLIHRMQLRFNKKKKEQLNKIENEILRLAEEKAKLRSERKDDESKLADVRDKLQQNATKFESLRKEQREIQGQIKKEQKTQKSRSRGRDR